MACCGGVGSLESLVSVIVKTMNIIGWCRSVSCYVTIAAEVAAAAYQVKYYIIWCPG